VELKIGVVSQNHILLDNYSRNEDGNSKCFGISKLLEAKDLSILFWAYTIGVE
jgi:hypothetical protein